MYVLLREGEGGTGTRTQTTQHIWLDVTVGVLADKCETERVHWFVVPSPASPPGSGVIGKNRVPSQPQPRAAGGVAGAPRGGCSLAVVKFRVVVVVVVVMVVVVVVVGGALVVVANNF